MDYQYDLVSNKVNQVDYENDSVDQYHHIFIYDADNGISSVLTSKNSILWDNDANYFYYAHDKLARVELGDQQVQGTDYAYTLQGWLKGVNSDLLDSNRDMGHDGLQVTRNLNRYFARDAYGYTLKYFKGEISSGLNSDYDAISTTLWNDNVSRFEAYDYNSDIMNSRKDLYNGEITAMATDIQQPQEYITPAQSPIILPQGTSYNYDQLKRLVEMKAYQNLDTSNVWGTSGIYNGCYHNWFTYDENGNIVTQKRGDQSGNIFDSLSYDYNVQSGLTIQNRLYNVNNAVNITNSMPNQGTFSTSASTINQQNNYRYTALGELAKDSIAGLDTIIWNSAGKLWKIKMHNGDSLVFLYDVKGDRIQKIYMPISGNIISTYYVRDAEGKTMAIYTKQLNPITHTLTFGLSQRDIYGQGRIGVDNTPVQLIGAIPFSQIDTFSRFLGIKRYELDNHLGNVLSTISDKKIPRSLDSSTGSPIDHYEADVISSQDYYPFGMLESSRNFSSTQYRYAFNGKEKTDEMYGVSNTYDYGARMFDPRLGRFLSTDPLEKKFVDLTPFQFASNEPTMAIDIDGKEAWPVKRQWNYSDRAAFGKFVNSQLSTINKEMNEYNKQKAPKEKEAKLHYDLRRQYNCADLAVALYVRYAAANGLPVELTDNQTGKKFSSTATDLKANGSTIKYDPNNPQASLDQFEYYARVKTGAASLVNNKDITPIPFSEAQNGDIWDSKVHTEVVNNQENAVLGKNQQVMSYGNFASNTDPLYGADHVETNKQTFGEESGNLEMFYRFKAIADTKPGDSGQSSTGTQPNTSQPPPDTTGSQQDSSGGGH